MRYQRALWRHDLKEEPIVCWSEIGDDGYERRKVDEYRDGRLDYADGNVQTGSTLLGDQRVPSLEEINRDAEFEATAVSREEFDAIWKRSIAR